MAVADSYPGGLAVVRDWVNPGGKKGQSTPMSDLMVMVLLLVCGAALLTAVAAVLAPGRLFRADPPPKPEPERRSKRRIGSASRRS